MNAPPPAPPSTKARLSTELKLFLLACTALLPVTLLLVVLWLGPELSLLHRVLLTVVVVLGVLWMALAVRLRFAYQIRTLNTLIEAIRTEDYSLRGTLARESGDLAELYQQINALADQLQQSRQEESELRGLLERIITQLNVAVIAYDDTGRIVLVNHLSEKLLDRQGSELIGSNIHEYQLDKILPQQHSQVLEHLFPGARGRWQLTWQTYVQHGKQGHLLFIADLEQVLSEEEIKAWQRLIRVIAHEVNNSLTPITSLCQTLSSILVRAGGPVPQEELLQGLAVINERAHNLKHFIADYARIARLPAAQKVQFDLLVLIRRILTIYQHARINVETQQQSVLVYGDQTQLEQVLINLIKNALEANDDAAKAVTVRIACNADSCQVDILDEGPGIANAVNLFVPFYTTKPQGAGIGLALSRRIVAAHGGDLQLRNRDDAPGALATLLLPLPTTPLIPLSGLASS